MYIPALWSPLGMTLPQTMIIIVFQGYQIFSLELMKDGSHTQYLTLGESSVCILCCGKSAKKEEVKFKLNAYFQLILYSYTCLKIFFHDKCIDIL